MEGRREEDKGSRIKEKEVEYNRRHDQHNTGA